MILVTKLEFRWQMTATNKRLKTSTSSDLNLAVIWKCQIKQYSKSIISTVQWLNFNWSGLTVLLTVFCRFFVGTAFCPLINLTKLDESSDGISKPNTVKTWLVTVFWVSVPYHKLPTNKVFLTKNISDLVTVRNLLSNTKCITNCWT